TWRVKKLMSFQDLPRVGEALFSARTDARLPSARERAGAAARRAGPQHALMSPVTPSEISLSLRPPTWPPGGPIPPVVLREWRKARLLSARVFDRLSEVAGPLGPESIGRLFICRSDSGSQASY